MASFDSSSYREFLKLQGHNVVETPSTVWINARRHVFQPAPPFHLHPDQVREASEALRLSGGLACRWFSETASPDDSRSAVGISVAYVLSPPYDLARIQPKARNQTRRGLERVEVRSTKFDSTLEQQARVVYADNVTRLGLFANSSQLSRRWQQWVTTLSAGRCAQFWGAWEGDRLIAFAVTATSPWGAEIVCQRSLGSARNFYPNNVLVYRIATSFFEQGIELLSYGLGKFGSHQDGLDHFKKGMAFQEIHLRDHFCWHPAIRFLNPILTARRIHSVSRFLLRSKRFVSPARR